MKSFVILSLLLFSNPLFANWSEDFDKLKNHPRSYEDTGAICEELARLKMEKIYSQPKFAILVGIGYGDLDGTLGELDVVVFDQQSKQVVKIAEVKCWQNVAGGLSKAKEQRQRFLSHLKDKDLYFYSTSNDQTYDYEQFKSVKEFSTLGQKGSVATGYDDELEYDLRELRNLRYEMIRCQERGECARPE